MNILQTRYINLASKSLSEALPVSYLILALEKVDRLLSNETKKGLDDWGRATVENW